MKKKTLLPDVTLTVPRKESRYMVTDEQIDMLCNGGKDHSLDWAMVFLGACFGLLQNFIAVVADTVTGSSPDAINIFLAMLFTGCLFGAASKYSEYRKTRSETDKLASAIKQGRKVNISENVVEMKP